MSPNLWSRRSCATGSFVPGVPGFKAKGLAIRDEGFVEGVPGFKV